MLTNKTTRNALLVLACVPALAGCKMLGIGGHGVASNASLHERLPEDFGATQLAVGRKALTDGHVPDAIESFMLARLYPAHAAAATNGLAVAYSKLGRTDLTERYFREAIALAPEDERFRSNLAKFYATNPIPRVADTGAVLAMMQDTTLLGSGEAADVAIGEMAQPSLAPALAAAPAPTPRALAGGITVESGNARVRRVSSGEVIISGGQPAGPAATVRRSRQAVIEVGARSAAPAAYPVRVTLGEAAAKRPAQYPVRIELSPR